MELFQSINIRINNIDIFCLFKQIMLFSTKDFVVLSFIFLSGNIMKFIADDGSTIYKLTDFGAARELQEGQQFVSLYGTEEYLHPDMYARAVLRKTEGKTFGATVDLWSIGVTLYHVATGNLPFRPYGGRRNKEIMFHITTKKASGVISGIQTKENGPIEWRKELPANCHLSVGLKKFITPLLAGLLEADPKKIWTFDKFFNEVTDMLSRKAINVFHVNKASLIKIYIHPDEKHEQLQNYLTEQTNIISENQIILLKETVFVDLVGENSRAEGYPTTTEQEPLILFSKENNNVEIDPETDLPKFSEFQNLVSVDNDASKAKDACSLGYVCKRRIEKAALHSTLITYSVESFSQYITNELKKLYQFCQHLTEICESRKETAQAIYLAQKAISTLLNEIESKITNHTEELLQISDIFFKEIKPRVQQLYEQNVIENKLKLEWEYSSRLLKCPAKTKAPAKARSEVERLRESWQHLVRDRATRTLSYNDEQFHNLERIKIMETVRRIKALLENEVVPAYTQFADNLGDWYKIAQTIYLQTMILNKDVGCYDQKLEQFHSNLMAENEQFKEDMRGIIEQKVKSKMAPVYQSGNFKTEQLRMSFGKLSKTKEEIMEVLSENNHLVEQINIISEKLIGSCKDT